MSLSIRNTVAAVGVFLFSFAPALRAQVVPMEWTIQLAEGVVHQGQQFTALVRVQIPYSWHVYSTTQPSGGPMATVFAVTEGNFALHGKVAAREPVRVFDAIAGMKTETYSDSVTFRVPMIASRSGKQKLALKVRYQSCTDRFCTPERAQILRTVVSVAPAVAKP